MKLYYSPGACSLAPHIVLRESNTSFEAVRVDTAAHKLADGTDFYRVNPKGYVPVLELDDGQRLTEGPIICQHIADRAKHTELMPVAGTLARYRVMEWQNYITSELHKSYSPLFSSAQDAAAKGLFLAGLRKKYAWVSGQLEGKAHLTGASFTAADAYLFVVTRWAGFVNLDLSDLRPLQTFMNRVSERAAVHEALKEEGLLK